MAVFALHFGSMVARRPAVLSRWKCQKIKPLVSHGDRIPVLLNARNSAARGVSLVNAFTHTNPGNVRGIKMLFGSAF